MSSSLKMDKKNYSLSFVEVYSLTRAVNGCFLFKMQNTTQYRKKSLVTLPFTLFSVTQPKGSLRDLSCNPTAATPTCHTQRVEIEINTPTHLLVKQ